MQLIILNMSQLRCKLVVDAMDVVAVLIIRTPLLRKTLQYYTIMIVEN